MFTQASIFKLLEITKSARVALVVALFFGANIVPSNPPAQTSKPTIVKPKTVKPGSVTKGPHAD